jgi:serine/threonine-protein kinase
MTQPVAENRDREQRLDEVVLAYLRDAQQGRVPDREEWLARYPDLAPDLGQFLEDQEQFERLTAALRHDADGARTPGPALDADTKSTNAPVAEDKLPYQFGNYELLEELGQGGMGVVHRARHKLLGRVVALKRIRLRLLASPVDVQRFRNEAQTAAALDHPHIVPLYEVGEHNGQLYFSMKLMEGGSLAAAVGQRRQQARTNKDEQCRAARIVATVARAVHHAHRGGVLHRDLKPSNILLDAGGQPHVTDFGLARRLADDSGLTGTGELLGTPSYMAPEQTSRKFGQITAATDVHGLGAILYALLTGRAPYQGESLLDTLDQVRWTAPPPPREADSRIERDLETICLKCLEKKPADRYPSVAAVADELDRYLAGKPIEARPLGLLGRFARWCRQPERVRSAGQSMLLFAVVFFVFDVMGVILIALNQVVVERPQQLMAHNLRGLGIYFLPPLVSGFLTRWGSVFGLWGGLIFTIYCQLVFAVHCFLFPVADTGGLEESEPSYFLLINILIVFWAGILSVMQAIGLVAHYSNKANA